MLRWILRVAIRLALVALAVWISWHWLGLSALVICAPLAGIALANPIMEFFAGTHRASKELALRDLQGRYYRHRGRGMDIADDEDGHRWLLLSDVRKLLDKLPRDEVLRRQFGERVADLGAKPQARIRADALVDYLRKSQDAASVKFKVWIEREVIHPSAARHG